MIIQDLSICRFTVSTASSQPFKQNRDLPGLFLFLVLPFWQFQHSLAAFEAKQFVHVID